MVRMHDVAERAGVSAKTVSRVMRGEAWVAPQTVSRVRSAMDELGYHGNETAGALRRGQTRILGLLCPLLTMSFWSDVAAGAEAAAHTQGYSLLLCDTSDSLKKEEDYLSLLLAHRVAGMIYVQPRCKPETHRGCAGLLKSTLPVVVISSDLNDLPYCHVRTDDTRAGYVAVRHLLDLGRRRFLIAGSGEYPASVLLPPPASLMDRVRGAYSALEEAGAVLREAGIAVADVPLWLAHDPLESGRAIGTALIEDGGPLPDAIFATSDVLALGILEVLRAHSVHVPEEVAVVGHDDLPAAAAALPSLTTIAPPRLEMGRTCIALLVRALAGEVLPPVQMLEATFRVRESTIGAGPVARAGVDIGLSESQAWSVWRTQLTRSPVSRADMQPPVRLTVGALTRWEEVMTATL